MFDIFSSADRRRSYTHYSHVDVVVGGQFGSESKGRVAAELVRLRTEQTSSPVVSVRVGGPNAGHVAVDDQGRSFAMRQIPVGFVVPSAVLCIAPGSEIDPEVLWAEVHQLEEAGFEIRPRLFISPEATILTPEHREQEQQRGLSGRIGSTAKGIGAARADRIWRTADRVCDRPELFEGIYQIDPLDPYLGCAVVIEGTQGYGLGLHAGHYPQCTSGDARAIDFLAQAGVMPWDANQFEIHMVIRPNPIRVSGNSGPLRGETTWDDLGLPEERTTVTQKVRRVGAFDIDLVRAAIRANGTSQVRVHLAMADHLEPRLEGLTDPADFQWADLNPELREILEQVQRHAPVVALGTGPATTMWSATYSDDK